MKILVIRLSSIGDIVLTTPVVRCLKKQLNAEVHFLTKKSHHTLVADNPYIDQVILYKDNLSETIHRLKSEHYDLIIDLHHNLRTQVIKFRLSVKTYSFKKLNIQKWLLVNFKIDELPGMHIVDRYLNTCKPLGIVNDGAGLDYFIPIKDEVDIATLPTGFQNGYVAWAIGAQGFTKRFPMEKITAVLKSTQLPVILLGGKEDRENGKLVCDALGDRITLYNAAGLYNLNQSASLIKQATLIVSNDTGLMHIAAALKKTIVSIWGNTVPEFGMYPYYGEQKIENRIVEVKGLSCRPCSKIGRSECPQGHFKCMRDIDENSLAREINTLIS